MEFCNKAEIEYRMFQYMVDDPTIYHTIYHTLDMIKLLDQLEQEVVSIDRCLYIKLYTAICYHDAVYKTGATNNEEKSAELFVSDYGASLNPHFVTDVVQLILATKSTFTEQQSDKIIGSKYIHDFDLSAFRSKEQILQNNIKLEKEALGVYTHNQFVELTKKFFNNLLQKNIYWGPFACYNELAHQNIKEVMNQIK